MKTFKFSSLLLICFLFTSGIYAQQKTSAITFWNNNKEHKISGTQDVKPNELNSLSKVIVWDNHLQYYPVVSFDMIIKDGKNEITEHINGDKLNDEQKGLLKNIKTGQKIYFNKIKLKYPDNVIEEAIDITVNVI
jgi:hypothetical protein